MSRSALRSRPSSKALPERRRNSPAWRRCAARCHHLYRTTPEQVARKRYKTFPTDVILDEKVWQVPPSETLKDYLPLHQLIADGACVGTFYKEIPTGRLPLGSVADDTLGRLPQMLQCQGGRRLGEEPRSGDRDQPECPYRRGLEASVPGLDVTQHQIRFALHELL